MRYLLLIYTEQQLEPPTDDAAAAMSDAYTAFGADIKSRGLMLAGEALTPTSSATTVQVRDGQTVTTDGPYAETKEALGGFYLIEARDLDEAIDVAAKIPGARIGSIEIRPIFEFGSTAQDASSEAVGASS
jgi:hypothetical protein